MDPRKKAYVHCFITVLVQVQRYYVYFTMVSVSEDICELVMLRRTRTAKLVS